MKSVFNKDFTFEDFGENEPPKPKVNYLIFSSNTITRYSLLPTQD
jgi:hypothetical protein